MRNIERLPGAKVISGLLWIVLLAGLLAWLAPRFVPSFLDLKPEAKVNEHISLTVLRSQELEFLVTRRASLQVVVEHEESDWSGQWHGVLWATVEIYFGVDLAKVKAEDIRHEGDVTIVTLPEPEVLSFAVEPGSVRCLSKSTAVPKVSDLLSNGHRQLLEGRLRESALEFARQQQMLPSRAELVARLNSAVAVLASKGGVRLRFE